MFSRYRTHLEAELVKQELLLKFVISDKEKIILRQEEEIKLLRAKCERLELLVIPGLRPAVARKPTDLKPVEGGETSWTLYLRNYMEAEEKAAKEAKEKANGVSGQSREGLHESASSIAVGSDSGHKQVPATEVRPANGQK